MIFAPVDRVQVALFGKGVVREVRNGGRYLVDVKGTSMDVSGTQLSQAPAGERPRRVAHPAASDDDLAGGAPSPRDVAKSIDLHGYTVVEAEAAVDAFVNDALLAGLAEVRVIHGISGGRVRAAVHARLERFPSVRGFRVDPSNPGVTIVAL
jgi:DNA mismatch repair protein MutS2